MTQDVEAVVLNALQKAAGRLNDADSLESLAAGQDISFEAWDLDSLDRFEAIMMIEDALGIELDDDDVAAQRGYRDLVAHVAAKQAQAGG